MSQEELKNENTEELEQSAIRSIYEIKEDIKFIKQYLKLLDNNLKLLSNKLSKLSKEDFSNNTPIQITATPGTALPPKPKDTTVDILTVGPIKVFGKIFNKNKLPIYDVQVNIYNQENQIVKTRKTDREGFWEVRLPTGRYGVEYIQEGYKPVNRTITLTPELKIFEVT